MNLLWNIKFKMSIAVYDVLTVIEVHLLAWLGWH